MKRTGKLKTADKFPTARFTQSACIYRSLLTAAGGKGKGRRRTGWTGSEVQSCLRERRRRQGSPGSRGWLRRLIPQGRQARAARHLPEPMAHARGASSCASAAWEATETPRDALNFHLKPPLEMIVLGPSLLKKKHQWAVKPKRSFLLPATRLLSSLEGRRARC